ncbi:hypothetical protein EJB05_11033 [Eragrostis curvula]|uniref:X8 domain-containing protein n=1 Tax=Eragrostis curvula TaxID=38414 RepID=A0A5J9VNG7_9POAL|nr:hypothetical protein EJB05_11033 [Eragrostis curvula]
MLNKRLQGCLLLLVLLVTNVSGSHPEATADAEDLSAGKRRLLQTTPTASGGMFCVAKQGADPTALQTGLNWACGPGHADCTAIQPGGPCYKQNDLQALASYAYNDYYHRNANSGATCNFNGTAITTATDPSSGQCVFSGSSMSGGTTPSANPPNTGFNPPSSFTPGTGGFGNGSSFGGPSGALVPLDGAESLLSSARGALCILLLMALPVLFLFAV